MIYLVNICENKCELTLGKHLAPFLDTRKCSPNRSYFYYPRSAYMNWSPLFLSLEMNPTIPQLLSHSFPTLGFHKMSHRGRNTFSSYARFIHLFICPKILLWTFNKSVEKMNSIIVLAWLRISNVLAKIMALLLPHSIPTHHEKVDLQNIYYLNHNCNIGWFIPLWLLGLV